MNEGVSYMDLEQGKVGVHLRGEIDVGDNNYYSLCLRKIPRFALKVDS